MIHNPLSRANRTLAGLVGGAVVSATFAAAALGSPATANATCASFFGIGSSAECTSSLTSIAIALGPGATAKATGLFTAALANGLGNSAGDTTIATADGSVNLAYAGGPNSKTTTHSIVSVGVVQGRSVVAVVGGVSGKDFFNAALSLGSEGLVGPPVTGDYPVLVAGNGNLAVDFFGGQGGTGGLVEVIGTLNSAFSVGSRGSSLSAGTLNLILGPAEPAVLSTVFNLFGTGNIPSSRPARGSTSTTPLSCPRRPPVRRRQPQGRRPHRAPSARRRRRAAATSRPPRRVPLAASGIEPNSIATVTPGRFSAPGVTLALLSAISSSARSG